MYGDVCVRLSGGKVVDGKLLAFTTIPIPTDNSIGHKVIIYGIVELDETGTFMARQLSEIWRRADERGIRPELESDEE